MNSDFVAIDYQFTVLLFDSALESAVSRVILEHVDHVFEINEGIIDSDDLDFGVFERSTQDNTANATETIKILHVSLVIHIMIKRHACILYPLIPVLIEDILNKMSFFLVVKKRGKV